MAARFREKLEKDMLLKGGTHLPEPKRGILLIQLGDIGDVVLTIPTIMALRQTYPNVKLGVCVREKARELIEDCPWLDEVVSVDTRKRKILKEVVYQLNFFKSLRENRFDWTIELRSVDRGAFLSVLSGASLRIGRAAPDRRYWRDRLYTHVVYPDPETERRQYAVEQSLNIIAPFNITTNDLTPVLNVPSSRHKQAIELLRQAGVPLSIPLVVIHPFSLWPFKEWKLDQWTALINFIKNRYTTAIVITGSKDERHKANYLLKHHTSIVFNLAGRTSLGVLAALLKHSRSFIGVDTGAMHMAAAVGTPTLSIFGPSPYIMWAPRGPDHHIVTPKIPCVPCRDKGCNDTGNSLCLEYLLFDDFRSILQNMLDKIFETKDIATAI